MQAIVVCPDPDEKEILTFVLRKAGLAVASSADIHRVLERWSDHPADLLVFSNSGQMDSLKSLESIRASTQIPLVMILDPPSERVLCQLLQRGADTVLSRPVSPQMLAAHVHALLRRSGGIPSFTVPTLELEHIALDPSTHTVTVSDQDPRRLTQLEFRLLYVLMTHRGQVVPTEVIVERVWGYTGEGNRELVRGLISRLRQKIESEDDQQKFIETIPSVGYRFVTDDI